MKKFILTLSIFILTAGFCNAQFYIGGGIGAASYNNIADDNLKNSRTVFDFAPKIGYVFNKRLLAGLEFKYLNITNKVQVPDETELSKEKTNSFRIRPYIRYNFITLGKFAFGAEAGAEYIKQETTLSKDINGIGFCLDLAPIVTFGINKHWWLETKLDIFGLKYETITSKVEKNDSYEKLTRNDFSFGFDMDNLLTLGAIKLGVVYRF